MGKSSKKYSTNQWLEEDRSTPRLVMREAYGDGQAQDIVRSIAHGMGYRYRVGGRGLPGSPHLVFPIHQTAIFVLCCERYRHHGLDPSWISTAAKDRATRQLQAFVDVLKRRGWRVEIIWGCQMQDRDAIARRLADLMPAKGPKKLTGGHVDGFR